MLINQQFGKGIIQHARTERETAGATGSLAPGQVAHGTAEDVDIVEFGNGNRLVQKHAAGQVPTSYTVEADGRTEERAGRFEVRVGPSVAVLGPSMEQVVNDDGRVEFKQFGGWGFTNRVSLDCHKEGPQKPLAFGGHSLWLDKERDSFHTAFLSEVWVDRARPDRLQVSVEENTSWDRKNPHAGEHAEIGLLLPWNVFAPKA